MITLTPWPEPPRSGRAPLISPYPKAQPRPGWQDQGIPASVPPSRDSRATSSLRIDQQPATTSALVTKWVKPTNINCRETGLRSLVTNNCGHARTHGGNVQAVLAPDGLPLWVSQAEPGSVHDITAARAHALPALYPAATADLPLPTPAMRARASAS
jgi:hypothetical protein